MSWLHTNSHGVYLKVVLWLEVIGELAELLVNVARVMSGSRCLWVEGFEVGLLLIWALALPPSQLPLNENWQTQSLA